MLQQVNKRNLDELLKDAQEIELFIQSKIVNLSPDELNWRINNKSWCIAQCLEHLYLLGSKYNDLINYQLLNYSQNNHTNYKKSNLLGRLLLSFVRPVPIIKIKSFKVFAPINHNSSGIIDQFLKYQQNFIALIDQSKQIEYQKIQIPSPFSKLIKLRLDDSMQLIINHEKRHIIQIENILNHPDFIKN